jgi:hypothetical protein
VVRSYCPNAAEADKTSQVRVGSFRYTAVTRNTSYKLANKQNLRMFAILAGFKRHDNIGRGEIAGQTRYCARQIALRHPNVRLIVSCADSHLSID